MTLERKLKEKYQEDFQKVDDIMELEIDGIFTNEKFADEDKKFLERFNHLQLLTANLLGLTSVQTLPALPSLVEVHYSLKFPLVGAK